MVMMDEQEYKIKTGIINKVKNSKHLASLSSNRTQKIDLSMMKNRTNS